MNSSINAASNATNSVEIRLRLDGTFPHLLSPVLIDMRFAIRQDDSISLGATILIPQRVEYRKSVEMRVAETRAVNRGLQHRLSDRTCSEGRPTQLSSFIYVRGPWSATG